MIKAYLEGFGSMNKRIYGNTSESVNSDMADIPDVKPEDQQFLMESFLSNGPTIQ